MASTCAVNSSDANLQALQRKREVLEGVLGKAFYRVDKELPHKQYRGFRCWCSRDGIEFMGIRADVYWGYCSSKGTVQFWNRVLSEGLGAQFEIGWYNGWYDSESNHWVEFSTEDVRLLRRGESIFSTMKSEGLNPDWNGSMSGKFTITVVDKKGAKLALAMALHPRLGASSRLSVVSSLSLTLVALRLGEFQSK